MTKKLTMSDWKVPALLLVLSMVPTLGGIARLSSMSGDSPVTPDNEHLFPRVAHREDRLLGELGDQLPRGRAVIVASSPLSLWTM